MQNITKGQGLSKFSYERTLTEIVSFFEYLKWTVCITAKRYVTINKSKEKKTGTLFVQIAQKLILEEMIPKEIT